MMLSVTRKIANVKLVDSKVSQVAATSPPPRCEFFARAVTRGVMCFVVLPFWGGFKGNQKEPTNFCWVPLVGHIPMSSWQAYWVPSARYQGNHQEDVTTHGHLWARNVDEIENTPAAQKVFPDVFGGCRLRLYSAEGKTWLCLKMYQHGRAPWSPFEPNSKKVTLEQRDTRTQESLDVPFKGKFSGGCLGNDRSQLLEAPRRETEDTFPATWVRNQMAMGSKPRTSSEHPNPHQNRLKSVVHLPQNGIPLVLTHGQIA